MEDVYYYRDTVRTTYTGASYYERVSYVGPLAFCVWDAIDGTEAYLGSSGIREYSSMSSQVPTTANGKVSDIAFESNYPYSLHPTATNGDINVGDIYYYGDGGIVLFPGGSHTDDYTSYGYDARSGPFAFHSSRSDNLTVSRDDLGSSGIREYSSMSSQVPTASEHYISDIAFESSYPYSLHPTAVNDYINVGDLYYYGSGVRFTDVGGAYSYDTYNGSFAIGINLVFTFSREDFGSSGIREYSSMSSQVPTANGAWISDIAFESNYPYSLHPTATNDDINVGDISYYYRNEVQLALVSGTYYEGINCGSFAFYLDHVLTFSDGALGSSGIREYSSMSSQVPSSSSSGAWVSDIAFESNYPYSLHPTAVNDDINVGDYYWYGNGVKVVIVGGSFIEGEPYGGPLQFHVYEALTLSGIAGGSSGYIQQQPMTL